MILDAGRRFRLSSPSHLIRFHYQMRENIYVCLDAHIIIPLSRRVFFRGLERRIEVGNKGEGK